MLVFRDNSTLQNHLKNLKNNNKIIGFVPTMGALHNGHLSLVKKSIFQNDLTVVSIFINPTQFNNIDDLKTYPSDIDKDLELLRSISDKIIVFNPEPDELYAGDIRLEKFNFNGLDRYMEGEFRGNHFVGVATVVSKLFSLIKADYAYFGEKDFQQVYLIKKYLQKHTKTKIISCNTIRNKNKLPLSSRNILLSKANLKKSEKISKLLFDLKNKISKNLRNIKLLDLYKNKINDLCDKIEYFEIRNLNNLSKNFSKENFKIFIAYKQNKVRLIENI